MLFTANNIAILIAFSSSFVQAFPFKRSNSLSLQFSGDGESGTTKKVPANTPTPFTAPFIPDITSITIIANFGFCTIFGKDDNKVLGTISLSEADFKAGKLAAPLKFEHPVQVSSYFCSPDKTTTPVPAPAVKNTPITPASVSPPVIAAVTPVSTQENPSASEVITVQVGNDSEARQFPIPVDGIPTDIVEIENTTEVKMIEGSATCVLLDRKAVTLGSVSEDEPFTTNEPGFKITTITCVRG
ncbi:hypothetical protein GLAREA_04163 [Glarea lozoyensis ATCC 20868]|uniref:Uncharacterized protein n=1 Tax=Glarea lozoyensis (strain ATCC 20868 / MF5171) TaxID=1116229 RepID=S3DGN3_GLAL2|nr:uncharacterized protein GLAREA_04163 [Glarea lozoyensis ATCC 20868]EPE31196.1 hypothetical protein GLAREA_04163 [Glarea lozoyensis ATCC 20868]